MNGQQLRWTLVDYPPAPHNGTPTSRTAAEMVNVGKQEQEVLDELSRWPAGLTQDELSIHTSLLRSAIAGRCNRLERLGYICKYGTRLTRYGRPAAVYVLGAGPTAQAAGARNSPAAT